MMLGTRVYGFAAILLGLVGLVWADFAAVWQPVPPELPGRLALAYGAAGLFVAAGLALQWRRTAVLAALALAALHLPFLLLWVKRVIGSPEIMATWNGMAEQTAILIGAVLAYACLRGESGRTLALAGRLVFGLCLFSFGTAHIVYVNETAAMVPAWLPLGTRFWALATGICHLAAGFALLSGVLSLLAARLLTAMFVGFGLLVWLPILIASPGEHFAWAGNAINFCLIAAAWTVADSIARFGQRRGPSPLGADSAGTPT